MKSMEVNTSGDRSKNKAGINILIYKTTYIAFKERSITRNREEWQKFPQQKYITIINLCALNNSFKIYKAAKWYN